MKLSLMVITKDENDDVLKYIEQHLYEDVGYTFLTKKDMIKEYKKKFGDIYRSESDIFAYFTCDSPSSNIHPGGIAIKTESHGHLEAYDVDYSPTMLTMVDKSKATSGYLYQVDIENTVPPDAILLFGKWYDSTKYKNWNKKMKNILRKARNQSYVSIVSYQF